MGEETVQVLQKEAVQESFWERHQAPVVLPTPGGDLERGRTAARG